MKCSLCGYQFKVDESAMTCRGCPFSKGCKMVRCPNCGFEVPAQPRVAKSLKKWRENVDSE